MRNKIIIPIVIILTALSLVSATIVYISNNKDNSQKTEDSTPGKQENSPITGEYISQKYGYSFTVPSEFNVTRDDSECPYDYIGDDGKPLCLEQFTLTPTSFTEQDIKYLGVGRIILIKDYKQADFNGATAGYSFNTERDKWVYGRGQGDGWVQEDKEPTIVGQNEVYNLGTGGSHGSTSNYLIMNPDNSYAFIMEIRSSLRVRCDMEKDQSEKEECITYLHKLLNIEDKSIDNEYVNDYFTKSYDGSDKILESVKWE